MSTKAFANITNTCPVCNAPDLQTFFEVENVPVQSVVLLRTKEEALKFPKGDIRLGYCQQCGFINNQSFDPSTQIYSNQYESTQIYSPTFEDFSKDLAKKLVQRHNLYQKDIIEIGCGNGEFLSLLCELGDNHGIGFDPSFQPNRIPELKKHNLNFIQDYYSDKYAHFPADIIICKMTLEHIANPLNFFSTLSKALEKQRNTIVFFQVPDVTRILQEVAFWDVYYEHCSYYSPSSLAYLFRKCGFTVNNLWREYDNQYVMIEAIPNFSQLSRLFIDENELKDLESLVNQFKSQVTSRKGAWREMIRSRWRAGSHIALWGAGSKAVSFLTTMGLSNEIGCCVDINPNKWGSYLPVTGNVVSSPEELQAFKPDLVIVMNPIYRKEIRQKLHQMNIKVEVITVNDLPQASLDVFINSNTHEELQLIKPSQPIHCPVCKSTNSQLLLSVPDVPVICNQLSDSQEEALKVRCEEIHLTYCHNCTHLFNQSFNPEILKYNQKYENSLFFSTTFDDYARSFAQELIKKYHLYQKDIIEIGSGDGQFLETLCRLGNNRGIGFDPSYRPDQQSKKTNELVSYINGYFTKEYAHLRADLICCRQVLEHIADPISFLSQIREIIGSRKVTLVLEVPNSQYMVRETANWDIIYEHPSYYSPDSLRYVLHSSGFEVVNINPAFGEQYLIAEAQPSFRKLAPDLQSNDSSLIYKDSQKDFAARYQKKVEYWEGLLSEYQKQAKKIVVWGAGSKGVSFLNIYKKICFIDYVIDINPRKQGKYVPGTGQLITSPAFLRDYHPDIIILMNPIYREEVSELTGKMGLDSQIIVV